MELAEARSVGHRRLASPLALQGAVADQRPEAILGWGQHLHGLPGEPPPLGLRAPRRRAQQAAVVLVGQVVWTLPGQSFEVGALPVDEGQHQPPAEHQWVPMTATGPQHPQALRDVAGQPGQGHGPGLLGETRSDRHSRASILGMAWTGKGFHAAP
jgi:hypothetical protein